MLLINAMALLATAASAAPFIERSLNSTKWTPDHVLQPGEVILFGEDRSKYPNSGQRYGKRQLILEISGGCP